MVIADIPGLPAWYDQLGSFDRNHIVKHFGTKIEPYIIESQVRACTLSEVLQRNHIDQIHLLHVDTEGYDYEVLKQLDFSKHKPCIIYIEHAHLGMPDKLNMLALLHGHGYSVCDCGMDFFASLHAPEGRGRWAALCKRP